MGYSACAPFPTTAFVEVLRFELMVERGLCEAATSIREEAQHETLCRIGCADPEEKRGPAIDIKRQQGGYSSKMLDPNPPNREGPIDLHEAAATA
jgi:hypothetical protein